MKTQAEFEQKILYLQKQLGEEKKAHGETILQLLSAKSEAEAARAETHNAQQQVTETNFKLNQAIQEMNSLRARDQTQRTPEQRDSAVAKKLQAAQEKILSLETESGRLKREMAPEPAKVTVQRKIESIPLKMEKKILSPNQFPILSLPFVALRHVLQVMEPGSMFFLTLFFSKIRKFAKSIIKNSTERRLEAQAYGETFKLFVKQKSGGFISMLTFTGCNKVSNSEKRVLGGQEVELSVQFPSDGSPKITFPNHQRDILWMEIEKTWQEILSPLPPLSVHLHSTDVPNVPKPCSNIRKLVICSRGANGNHDGMIMGEVLDDFLDSRTVTEVARVGCLFYGSPRVNSKLFNVRELQLVNANWFSIHHLSNFTGKHLSLYQTSLKTEHIRQFLSSWLSGSYKNLETMIVSHGDFNPALVSSWYIFHGWDSAKRPAKYVVTSEYSFDPEDTHGYYDCTNAWDIERASDGHLASIKVTSERFLFFVWR